MSAPCGDGSAGHPTTGAARRARLRKARQTSRHVAWLLDVQRARQAHHTAPGREVGGSFAPAANIDDVAILKATVADLQLQIDTLVDIVTRGQVPDPDVKMEEDQIVHMAVKSEQAEHVQHQQHRQEQEAEVGRPSDPSLPAEGDERQGAPPQHNQAPVPEVEREAVLAAFRQVTLDENSTDEARRLAATLLANAEQAGWSASPGQEEEVRYCEQCHRAFGQAYFTRPQWDRASSYTSWGRHRHRRQQSACRWCTRYWHGFQDPQAQD